MFWGKSSGFKKARVQAAGTGCWLQIAGILLYLWMVWIHCQGTGYSATEFDTENMTKELKKGKGNETAPFLCLTAIFPSRYDRQVSK